MRPLRWLVGWFVVLALSGCSLLPADPTTAVVGFDTQVAQGVAATLTADAPLPAFMPTALATEKAGPLPTVLPAATAGIVPTPVIPTSRFFTDARYELDEERLIGGYAIRVWRNSASAPTPLGFDRIATIAQAGAGTVQIEFFDNLDPLTGGDITGDGTPDVVIETYSGGAHCCFSTLVYSLGPQIEKVLETPASNCGGEFRDLDDDGVLEYITCDDRFAYAYCPFAASPVVTAVLSYAPGAGYSAASPRFGDIYSDPIAAHTTLAEQAQPGGLGEWDVTTKCAVLPLVLDYLYSGQTEQAWLELERLYRYPDADAFREEIEQTIQTSPLYVGGS